MSTISVILLLLGVSGVISISVKHIPESGTPPSFRSFSVLTLDSRGNKLYMYGGKSEISYSDMWEFDLSTNQWAEIQPGSVLTPGIRSNTYLTTLEDQRKIVLFGGDLPTGPTSDVWLFDIENEYVMFIQWKLVDPIGKPPPRAYYRAVCDYFHEGRHYIAVYGGLIRNTPVHTLFM
jgi:hypothetical protein